MNLKNFSLSAYFPRAMYMVTFSRITVFFGLITACSYYNLKKVSHLHGEIEYVKIEIISIFVRLCTVDYPECTLFYWTEKYFSKLL